MKNQNLLEPSLPKALLAVLIFLLIYSFIGYCLPFKITPKYGSEQTNNQLLPCGYVSSPIGKLHNSLNEMSVWPWYTFEALLLVTSYLAACTILTGCQKSPTPSPTKKEGKTEGKKK